MMKNSFFLFLIGITVFFNCNSIKNKNKSQSGEYKTKPEVATSNKTATLSIEPNVFKFSTLSDTVSVKMMNNTNNAITTGLHYRIEVLKNEWQEISPENMIFNDIGFVLKAFDYRHFKKQVLKEKINYKTGKYRIVKHYLKPDYQSTKKIYDVHAEFSIE